MWRDAYLENRVLSADPVELVYMVYEHAIGLVGKARTCLAAGDILGRSNAIMKTLELLAELQATLNHEAGGEISHNLERLYKHMTTRLMTANIKQQDQPLAEVEALLRTLSEGWKGIQPQALKAAAGDSAASHTAQSNAWTGAFGDQGAGSEHTARGWKA